MYRLSNLWNQEPVAIAETVKAILLVIVLLGLIQVTSEQLAAIVLAISLILGLFVRRTVDSGETAARKAEVIDELKGTIAGQQALIDGRAGIPPVIPSDTQGG